MKRIALIRPIAAAVGLTLMLWGATASAQAQYKVVHPDGSVTYTDRPPIASNARVTNLGRSGVAAAPSESALPAELRSAAAKHPVTLYASPNCLPCDSARRFLQQRGVPYSERLVTSEDDSAALERLVAGRTVPSLSVGAQPLRGFSEADWSSYLDAAGYPRDGKLPASWKPPQARPLVERVAPPVAAQEPAPVPVARTPELPPPAPGRIRF